jgi:hypothetical protein
VNPLPDAVTETVYFPLAMVDPVPMVRLVEDPAVMVVAPGVVIPLGEETDSASGAVKVPRTEPQETATVADWPAVSETAFGLALKLHEAGTVITSEMVAVCVVPPPAAVITRG